MRGSPGFPENGVDAGARLGNVGHVRSAQAHFPKTLVKLLFVAICPCVGFRFSRSKAI